MNNSAKGRLMSGAENQELQKIGLKVAKSFAASEEKYRKERREIELNYHKAVVRFCGNQGAPKYLLDAAADFFGI